MKLEDITLEFVKECYRRTGLKPSIYSGGGACALQAVAVARLGPGTDIWWLRILDNPVEAIGFGAGFDGTDKHKDPIRDRDPAVFDSAYEVGNAIAVGLGLRKAPVPDLHADYAELGRLARAQIEAEQRAEVAA